MISQTKLLSIMTFLSENGFDKTVEAFGIKDESLKRYIRLSKKNIPRQPKILLFDVETAPMKVLSWSLFKPILGHKNIISDWYVISWSAKWLFSPDIMGDAITPEEALANDDKRIVKSIWELIDQADIIIAHNGDKFDIKKLNTRFLLHKLPPPSPYQSIDTLVIARKNFLLSSNRLDFLGQLIRNKGKIETNLELWIRCINGEKEALDEMLKYNKEDVNLLEEVYVFLRPWMKSHPNVAIYTEANESSCPVCGSKSIVFTGYYTTMAGQYQSFRCTECGAPSRLGANMLSLNDRKKLLRSTAR